MKYAIGCKPDIEIEVDDQTYKIMENLFSKLKISPIGSPVTEINSMGLNSVAMRCAHYFSDAASNSDSQSATKEILKLGILRALYENKGIEHKEIDKIIHNLEPDASGECRRNQGGLGPNFPSRNKRDFGIDL